jgi:four helix bundle protein
MRDHRSLIAWQAGMDLAVGASLLARTRWHPSFRHGYDQLVRATLSAPLNISEGYVWRPVGKWLYHLRVAYGSLVEAGDAVEYLLRVGACPPEDLAEIRANLRTAQRTTLALLKKSTVLAGEPPSRT